MRVQPRPIGERVVPRRSVGRGRQITARTARREGNGGGGGGGGMNGDRGERTEIEGNLWGEVGGMNLGTEGNGWGNWGELIGKDGHGWGHWGEWDEVG